jgi:hypothetical protein
LNQHSDGQKAKNPITNKHNELNMTSEAKICFEITEERKRELKQLITLKTLRRETKAAVFL